MKTLKTHKAKGTRKTIKARISEKGLRKVGLFFNHSTKTILNELLQNTRRAKATMVELEVIETSPKNCKVTILDNGCGIEKPENLLWLWESGWDENTQGLESPAGLGFFSLCHLPSGVTVQSNDWQVHIDKHIFEGQGEVETEPSQFLTGTRITFYINARADEIIYLAKEAALHFPIPTKINREAPPQEDFLKDARFIHTYPGGRIGIYENGISNGHVELNFHGIKLKTKIECPNPNWHMKVDIEDNRLLDLVLPARNEVVENQKLEDLRLATALATYQYAAIRPKGHPLTFEHYLRAKSFGISMPEANARLEVAMPHRIWNRESEWGETLCPNYRWKWNEAPPAPTKDGIVSNLGGGELAALHLSGENIPLLFQENRAYEGYSWYPTTKAVEVTQKIEFKTRTFDFHPDGDKNWNEIMKEKGFPQNITVQLALSKNKKRQILKFPTHIAFDASEFGEDQASSGWVCVRGKNKKRVDAYTLEVLFFSPSDDYEADSYNSQQEYFEEMANREIVGRYQGEKREKIFTIESKLNHWDIQCALKDLRAKKAALTISEHGDIKISITETHAKKPSKK